MLKKYFKKSVAAQERPSATRRTFLTGAAAATTGAAIAGFPMIAKAQGVTSMRWQSTWPAKDIFHEYALDFAKKVNDMTGGDLKIEVLPAGAVVPAFGLLDAVSKGTLDGGPLLQEFLECAEAAQGRVARNTPAESTTPA